MRTPSRAFLLLAVATAAGCATQADLQEIRREQRGIRSQLADTRATLDGVQRDLAKTRGKVQENQHAEQSDTRVQSLEERVAALEGGRVGTPADVSAVPAPGAPPAPETARVASVPAADRDDSADVPDQYRAAITLVRQKEYDRAIQQFREFLRSNADSPLAGNAHYWIGECYFTLGDYSQAILQYNEVRQRYAKSDRAAPALLKIGLSFLEMGNKSEARLAFQKVMNDYPASPEAGQAREKLRSLGT
ncbi:MAG: tol-pal system protein YbgF [Deltaproteobacteria bacterium]|nr:tol-pal system protein YbgF [Deltaproteobacteria bacterium]